MRKGERTRNMIIERAAALLNQQGYLTASLSAIMEETGMEKGGIYNHFRSKEELALAAFDYSCQQIGALYRDAYLAHERTTERLVAMFHVFCRLLDDPPVPGGCPLMNAAVEADDLHPLLRERVQENMSRLNGLFREVVAEGIAQQELPAESDPEALATLFLSTLEGALMISRLYGDSLPMRRAVEFLTQYVTTLSK